MKPYLDYFFLLELYIYNLIYFIFYIFHSLKCCDLLYKD